MAIRFSKIISIVLAMCFSFKADAAPTNIDCMAIYTGLSIGLEKKGQHGAAKSLTLAFKNRFESAVNKYGPNNRESYLAAQNI
jgi:hypothetical protein